MWKITSRTSCGRRVCSTLGTSVAWALAGGAVRICTGMLWDWSEEVLEQPASGSNSRTSILAFMASSLSGCSQVFVQPLGHVVLASVEHAADQFRAGLAQALG